jgi:hypothetical protein
MARCHVIDSSPLSPTVAPIALETASEARSFGGEVLQGEKVTIANSLREVRAAVRALRPAPFLIAPDLPFWSGWERLPSEVTTGGTGTLGGSRLPRNHTLG